MRISIIDSGSRFRVESDSGKTYEISYSGSFDGDPEHVATWSCSCPGYRHRGKCKHMTAFLNSRIMDHGDPYYEGDDDVPSEIVIQ